MIELVDSGVEEIPTIVVMKEVLIRQVDIFNQWHERGEIGLFPFFVIHLHTQVWGGTLTLALDFNVFFVCVFDQRQNKGTLNKLLFFPAERKRNRGRSKRRIREMKKEGQREQ
jgi:hypothetical protein